MEDGDTVSYQVSSVIQDSVFLGRKMCSINGYFWLVYNKGSSYFQFNLEV